MGSASLVVYAGVKARGMKGKLMQKKDLQTLAESRDLDELVTRLKNTSYGDAIAKITKPFTASKIDLALRDRQAEQHHTMIQASGGSNVLYAYYTRFILRDLKIILKGKILGRTQEQIESSVSLRAEELIKERDMIVKALIAKDADEAVNVLKGIGIAQEVERAYALYNEKKQIQMLDMYFDKFFYENLGRAVKSSTDQSVHVTCGTEIDFYNIMSILRGKFWGLDENQIQHLLVPQGSGSSKEIISRMISADSIKNALNELLSTRYKELVPQEENPIDAISQFERAFEIMLYNNMRSEFVRIFSFSTVVAITRLLDFEIRNLSSISFAVEQNIPTDVVMARVIVKD
ncbi:MAG: V0D/AC39 family V-type ATPase subunit [Candidatus Nitrosotenuis sp.]